MLLRWAPTPLGCPTGWPKPTLRRCAGDHAAKAYRKARQRERDVILPDGTTYPGRSPAHWQRNQWPVVFTIKSIISTSLGF